MLVRSGDWKAEKEELQKIKQTRVIGWMGFVFGPVAFLGLQKPSKTSS